MIKVMNRFDISQPGKVVGESIINGKANNNFFLFIQG
jgi:hypothetical protein